MLCSLQRDLLGLMLMYLYIYRAPRTEFVLKLRTSTVLSLYDRQLVNECTNIIHRLVHNLSCVVALHMHLPACVFVMYRLTRDCEQFLINYLSMQVVDIANMQLVGHNISSQKYVSFIYAYRHLGFDVLRVMGYKCIINH